ncbi:MAG: SGNH/GDSL hydrolase family protein [bacterium]
MGDLRSRDRMTVLATVARTVLATVAINAVLVALVFGTVNPLGDFWGDIFPTATPVSRKAKLALFDDWRSHGPVDGVILGASRNMKLAPEAFTQATGLRYFNFSLAAATLEDVQVVQQILEEKHIRPREIVLGIDPALLSKVGPAHEALTDWEFARRIEGAPPSTGWTLRHGAELIRETLTPRFVKAVGTSIMAGVEKKDPLHHFYADGYVDYRPRDRLIAEGHFPRESLIKSCTKVVMGGFVTDHEFDPGHLAMLDSILARAVARGARVTLWLTPDHPDLANAVAQNPAIDAWNRAVPDTLRSVAARHGVPFVNLHALESFGGDPDDYYDCAHFGNANAARITTRLLEARGPSPAPSLVSDQGPAHPR